MLVVVTVWLIKPSGLSPSTSLWFLHARLVVPVVSVHQTWCSHKLRVVCTYVSQSIFLDGASLTSRFVHIADFGQHTEFTLQGVLNKDCTLRLFIENEEEKLPTQTTEPGHQPNARIRMCLVYQLRTPTDTCACMEVIFRHPRFARRSK